MFAAGGSAELGDNCVSEVDAIATPAQRGKDYRVLVNPQLAGIQEALDQYGGAVAVCVRPVSASRG